LILELKLPPADAYFKLLHTIEEVNSIVSGYNNATGMCAPRLSPELGNVCFASAQHGWSFTLKSFAQKYKDIADGEAMAKRLWGDWFFDPESRAFSKRNGGKNSAGLVRTFVQFVMDPIYKLYSQVIGETPEDLVVLCKRLGITLKNSEMHMDPKPLLRVVMSRFFVNPSGFVDMVVQHVLPPSVTAADKVSLNYCGLQNSLLGTAMCKCDSAGPLMINVVKLYNTPDGTKFLALGRIYSGTVRSGQRVRVLGESYSTDDDEDMCITEVTAVFVPGARFSLEISSARAGNLVLLEGVDDPIKKTATITDISAAAEDAAVFRPLQFGSTVAVMKVAVEPLKPSELPKLVTSLRRINKSYPCVTTKVEESGEHVIFGTGELHLDCILHDLRNLYADLEIKVADPAVAFCETVAESSSIKCFSETPNKKNKLTLMAEPLESGLAGDIEIGAVRLSWDRKAIGDFFQKKYDWDLLASRSVWAFGPEECGPNLLMDDTLPSEVDKSLLGSVRESIVQGFKWGCREGPLCDEPIRNAKFKILDAIVTGEPLHRGGGQIIPTARRVVYSSFLMATPRLMEPIFSIEIQAPADAIQVFLNFWVVK
jgi:116 kDa U5 small nuclear ribonucleoprotein component